MIRNKRAQRFIKLRGGVNFRDIGGYSAGQGLCVDWGLVFRSGSTHQVDSDDLERLRELGIRTLVDLRSARERVQFPHGLADHPQVEYLHSQHDHKSGNLIEMTKDVSLGAERMDEELFALYRELPYKFSEIYGRLFSRLAFGPLPLVFNCAAGKDRTGVAAALLLQALGVGWDDIVGDYMLSSQSTEDAMRMFGWSKERVNSGRYSPSAVTTLFGVKPSYLDVMKQSVIERSGSFENFMLAGLGLEPHVLDNLRQRLLVASPGSRS